MELNCIEVRKKLKSKLSENRYEHTLGVAYTCMALAMKYQYPLHKAELAGLLHDCAKGYRLEDSFEKCEKYGLILTRSEREAPALIHARLGACVAADKYGVEDPEILEAIRCHTTGKPQMGLLDKLLYVADYIEPRRSDAPDLPQLRRLAFEDLDQALFLMMEGTLSYLKERGGHVDNMTAQAYEYYKRQRLNEKENT